MVLNPSLYGFTAEFRGEHPAFGEFEEYLRTEFANQYPGWEPRFGEGINSDVLVLAATETGGRLRLLRHDPEAELGSRISDTSNER